MGISVLLFVVVMGSPPACVANTLLTEPSQLSFLVSLEELAIKYRFLLCITYFALLVCYLPIFFLFYKKQFL